jgi:hypothetical protein
MMKAREDRRVADIVYKESLIEAATMALPTKFLNDTARSKYLTRVPTYRQLYFTPPRFEMQPFIPIKLQKMNISHGQSR